MRRSRSRRSNKGTVARVAMAAIGCLLMLPAMAFAQASVAGVVRDTSGAILPGVTVEVTSPALIEKVRTAVSDGNGRYQIISLPPGVYTVRFALPGFASVQREEVRLSGSFAATVDAEMRVAEVEETVTVTGEAPIVDVRNVTQQRVMDREILDVIPAGRTAHNFGLLIPGVILGQGAQTAGGVGEATSPNNAFEIHGSKATDQQISQNGVKITGITAQGYSIQGPVNNVATQEIVFDTAAGSVENLTGGVRINYVPREGGNRFSGSFFSSVAPESLQASNLTRRLEEKGIGAVGSIKTNRHVNAGVGGPISQDRLWFFFAGAYSIESGFVTDSFFNKNLNKPDVFTFEPDLSRPAFNKITIPDEQLNLTWQATRRDKIGFLWHEQHQTQSPLAVSNRRAVENAWNNKYNIRTLQANWTAPMTNELLLEAGATYIRGQYPRRPFGELDDPATIRVTEQSTGMTFRGAPSALRNFKNKPLHLRAVASYVTGTHAVKVGMDHTSGFAWERNNSPNPISYRLNRGVPNRITLEAEPWEARADIDHMLGVFAQDSWAIDRMTVTYGLRYDYFANSFPEQIVGPVPLAPNRNFTFPKQSNIAWHDVSPRLGAAYDLFGTGRTALKVSLNRYLSNMGAERGLSGAPNPVRSLVNVTSRSWNDRNGDFVPDCDLVNPAANGECGAFSNANFGSSSPGATYDPDLMRGWGKRLDNWELSAGVQHQLLPRVGVEAAFFRRSYGNFVAVDNRNVGPEDFDTFSLVAPTHPDLPGGGGYVISGVHDVKPEAFGRPLDSFVTRAKNFGDETWVWTGADFTMRAQPRAGVLLQGGLSTGRTVRDNCEIVAKLPEMLFDPDGDLLGTQDSILEHLPASMCRRVGNFETQLKFLGSYLVPRVDVQLSASLQSRPGPTATGGGLGDNTGIRAIYNVPNSEVAAVLGRNLAGGARNLPVNIVEPGSFFGQRLNQLDVRVAKLFRLKGTVTRVNFDLYNMLNHDTVLRENDAFGPTWRKPESILPGRTSRISVQFDF